jgi:hypothetical protein
MPTPLLRTIETTLIGDGPPISFLFCALHGEAVNDVADICETLGITVNRLFYDELVRPGFLEISAGALLTQTERGRDYQPGVPLSGPDGFDLLMHTLAQRGRRQPYAANARYFTERAIVVEESPPSLVDFVSIVTHGSGAAIGAYTGYAAGQSSPLLLLVTVPFGILICASAMGLAQALERGLRERLYDSLRARRLSRLPDGGPNTSAHNS